MHWILNQRTVSNLNLVTNELLSFVTQVTQVTPSINQLLTATYLGGSKV